MESFQILNYIMQGLNEIESGDQLEQYKNCQFCGRRFFADKLFLHNKFCDARRPMRSPQKIISRQECPKCLIKLDPRLFKVHLPKCNQRPPGLLKLPSISGQKKEPQTVPKKQKKIDFPKLNNSSYQYISCVQLSTKIVNQSCKYCFRKFTKAALLRHQPICKSLKFQQSRDLKRSGMSRSRARTKKGGVCRKCGSKIRKQFKFCGMCGSQLQPMHSLQVKQKAQQ